MVKNAVIQVIGYKNTGKTTTVGELIKRFTELGLQVGSIKHDAHEFEVDYPGKDTWKYREAGAAQVAITSKNKFAIMGQQPISLTELLNRFEMMDLVIVEGYKREDYPKIVIVKDQNDLSLVEQSSNVLAIASWFPYKHPDVPVVANDDYESLFNIIRLYVLNGVI